MGCLFAIFTIPYHFIRWVIDHGWKGLIVLVVVVVALLIGFFVIQGQVSNAMAPKPPTTSAVTVLPGLKVAPFEVKTPTRTYYAFKAVKNPDGTVTLTDWWELLKGEWKLTKGTLVLDKTFGTITIKKR